MTKIEELKAALDAATPGEWKRNGNLLYSGIRFDDEGFRAAICQYERIADVSARDQFGYDTQLKSADNVIFIALAHNMMPQLLDVLEGIEHFSGIGLMSDEPKHWEAALCDIRNLLEKLK